MNGGGLHLLILAFLAVGWVVNQLFTKEERPPAQRPTPRPPARPTGREPVLRWENTGEPPRSPRPPQPAPGREDVLVIRPEPTRPSRPLSPEPPPAPARRGQRGRAAAAPARRAEPERPRTFAGDVAQSVAQAMERPAALAALSLEQTPQTVARAIRTAVVPGESPVFVNSDLANSLRDPKRLREAFLVNEILGPPKALRARGRA